MRSHRHHATALALCLALTGCATLLYPEHGIDARWQRQRLAWIGEHRATLTPEVARAVYDGRVIAGMSVDEARAAWMQWVPPWPEDVIRTTVGRREVYAHLFTSVRGDRVFYVEDGRVVAAVAELTDAEVRALRHR